MKSELGLHHAALTVKNLDTSSSWYQDVLGLTEEFRAVNDNGAMAVLRLPGSRLAVGLVEHGDGSGGPFDPKMVGLDNLAFSVTSRPALEGWVSELDHHDVTHSGIIEIPPGAVVNFKDPDGIALVLFWDRPGTVSA